MGNVYLKCPLSGSVHWYDWTTYESYVARYGNFDTGRFIWCSE